MIDVKEKNNYKQEFDDLATLDDDNISKKAEEHYFKTELLEKIINLRIKLENSKYKGKKIMIIRSTNVIKLLYRENNSIKIKLKKE